MPRHNHNKPFFTFCARAITATSGQVMLGGHSTLDPPLPISNRTVKRSRADDSAHYVCESRSPPGSPFKTPLPSHMAAAFQLLQRFSYSTPSRKIQQPTTKTPKACLHPPTASPSLGRTQQPQKNHQTPLALTPPSRHRISLHADNEINSVAGAIEAT